MTWGVILYLCSIQPGEVRLLGQLTGKAIETANVIYSRIKHRDVVRRKQPVKSFGCPGQVRDAVQGREEGVVALSVSLHL